MMYSNYFDRFQQMSVRYKQCENRFVDTFMGM